jgi:putative transposase
VRKRKGRRRAVGVQAPLAIAALPNARWSLDFVHDQLACGRGFRILNVVDDATRECLLAVADTSISGKRVVRELMTLVARRVAGPERSCPTTAPSSHIECRSRLV